MPNIFRQYICVRQQDEKDCGAACLATISKQFGLNLPISRIRESAGTDKQGTSLLGIVRAAEGIGFTAKGVKGDSVSFFEAFPLPAIAHVVVDGTMFHYVVIHKITSKKVLVADPAKGLVKYTPQQFFGIWTGILILLSPSIDFQKGKEAKNPIFRFLNLFVLQKGLLAFLFLSSLLFTLFGIGTSFYFQFLIDRILPSGLIGTLHIISTGVIVLYLFRVVIGAFRNHVLLYLSQKIDIHLILGYYNHVMKLPMSFFSTRKTGEIVSRLIDASKIRDALSNAAMTLTIDTLMAITTGFILYLQNRLLFGLVMVMVPLYALLILGFRKTFEKLNRELMEKNAQLNSYIMESINGIETVKAYGAETLTNFETEKKFITLLRTVFKFGFINNIQMSAKGAVQLVGGAVVLWVGSYQVIQGNMTIGQLLTFNALLAYFLEPIQNLINLQSTLQTAAVAAERLGEILDLEPEANSDEVGKIIPSGLGGEIVFRHVDFRYGMRGKVLQDICLTVHHGERIALVGESGSGKTTLAKLLIRLYPIEKGGISINGYNIEDIHLNVLRDKIAYIPQEIFFFSGTIQENLALGSEASLEEIVEVSQLVYCHEFIERLPLRYNTMLEENASNLSGGQRQRLAIARALLKKPEILIMDESTSSLDSTTEKAISEAVERFTGVTTILIAHRLSTIMRCNRIYVMNQGKIVEEGDHKELLRKRGTYFSLWKDQLPGITDSSNLAGMTEIAVKSEV